MGFPAGWVPSAEMKSHRRVRISTLLPLGVLLGGLALATTACQTAPVRVWRGAGHFSAGTDALVAGQGARAVAELEQAAELVPGASEIRNHLGLAYLAEGREREARAAFASAIELDCGNWAARQNLEVLQEQTSQAATRPVQGSAATPTTTIPTTTTPMTPIEEDAQHGG